MPPKRLVCDRCGFELTGKDDIEKVLEGAEAWWAGVRSRGEEPRGFFPCKNYMTCRGEMIIADEKGKRRKGGNGN